MTAVDAVVDAVVDAENPHAGQGMVLLDIGGDVGALVVTMPASMVGDEVEIKPEGAAWDDHASEHDHDHRHGHGHDDGNGHGHHSHHPHVAVHERPAPDGTRVPSLVFPGLVAGRYELYVKGTRTVELHADVRGGAVSTADWPAS